MQELLKIVKGTSQRLDELSETMHDVLARVDACWAALNTRPDDVLSSPDSYVE